MTVLPKLFLCMDAGQTGVQASVTDNKTLRTRVNFPGVRSDVDIVDQLVERVTELLAGYPGREAIVTIGASGLRLDADVSKFFAAPQVVDVHIAHDSVTGYLSVLGNRSGVVLAVGTGSVILGVGSDRVARVDGWGHLLGDAGSGFWLGREALAAVLRAHDGRGPQTALTDAVLERYPNLDVLYVEIQVNPRRVSEVASWAKTVADLAPTDAVSGDIVARAASELVSSTLAALDGAGVTSSNPRVGMVGNVFRGESLRTGFTAGVLRAVPGAELFSAVSDGLAGAALLPEVGEESALASHILRVSR